MPIMGSSGQSNDHSYAQGAVPFSLSQIDGRVAVWDSRTLEPADPDTITDFGTAWTSPANGARPYNSAPGLIAADVWLAHLIARARDEPWLVVHSPRGGQEMAQWWSGTRQRCLLRFDQVYDRAKAAVGGDDVMHLFSWQHGEHDATLGTDLDLYKTNHKAMIAHLAASGRVNTATCLLFTGLHPDHPNCLTWSVADFNAAMTDLTAEYSALGYRTAFVVPRGKIRPGPVHWDAYAQFLTACAQWEAVQQVMGW